jgi:hypothetical protein
MIYSCTYEDNKTPIILKINAVQYVDESRVCIINVSNNDYLRIITRINNILIPTTFLTGNLSNDYLFSTDISNFDSLMLSCNENMKGLSKNEVASYRTESIGINKEYIIDKKFFTMIPKYFGTKFSSQFSFINKLYQNIYRTTLIDTRPNIVNINFDKAVVRYSIQNITFTGCKINKMRMIRCSSHVAITLTFISCTINSLKIYYQQIQTDENQTIHREFNINTCCTIKILDKKDECLIEKIE